MKYMNFAFINQKNFLNNQYKVYKNTFKDAENLDRVGDINFYYTD